MRSHIFSAILLVFLFLSCSPKKEDRAFKVFNEGVALNLDAVDENNKGNYQKAIELNKQSIEKYRETLKIDSAHSGVRSALAHSFYMDKQYAEAIRWFTEANKLNGDFIGSYREMGLCKINLGQIDEGKKDLDKAIAMDKSHETRDITVQDLAGIGELAYEYGDGYIAQGEPEKGKSYKAFSIEVFKLAYEYDKSQKAIALKISDLAAKMNYKDIAATYKSLATR